MMTFIIYMGTYDKFEINQMNKNHEKTLIK
jgi:hypothetical protein